MFTCFIWHIFVYNFSLLLTSLSPLPLTLLVWNMCVYLCVCVLVWHCRGSLAGAGAAQGVQESRVLASSVRVLDGRSTLPSASGCQRI